MERVPRPLDHLSAADDDAAMVGFFSTFLGNVVALVIFVAVIAIGLRVAQSIFGAGSLRGAAVEGAARVVSYPTGSANVLRRRFVRALVGQHVVMPSGERLAFRELTVRVAPEDLARLDPDGDLERLGEDGARVYLTHAERSGWQVPDEVWVSVEVDPALRSGWIPAARGSGAPASRRHETRSPEASTSVEPGPDHSRQPRVLGWDVIDDVTATANLRPVPAVHSAAPTLDVVRPSHADAPTVNVAPDLKLRRGHQVAIVPRSTTTILGRTPQSPITFSDPQVSHRHVALRLEHGRWQVMDMGSTNGSSLDGQDLRVDAWTDLRGGARLALAGIEVEVVGDTPGTVAVGGLTGAR